MANTRVDGRFNAVLHSVSEKNKEMTESEQMTIRVLSQSGWSAQRISDDLCIPVSYVIELIEEQ